MKISVETTPSTKLLSKTLMAELDAVSVTHLPGQPFQHTVDRVNQINDLIGAPLAFPHLAARNFVSHSELTNGLQSMGTLRQVLIVGGGHPNGRVFLGIDDVCTVLEDLNHSANRHCSIDPNTHTYAKTLMGRYSRYDYGFNQLCLNPKRLATFKTQTVFCLPTQAQPAVLTRFIKRCGVRSTFRGIWHNMNFYHYITGTSFDVNRFWRDIGRLDNDVHFYNVGKLEKTIDEFKSEFN